MDMYIKKNDRVIRWAFYTNQREVVVLLWNGDSTVLRTTQYRSTRRQTVKELVNWEFRARSKWLLQTEEDYVLRNYCCSTGGRWSSFSS
jgi:hypothetical protein